MHKSVTTITRGCIMFYNFPSPTHGSERTHVMVVDMTKEAIMFMWLSDFKTRSIARDFVENSAWRVLHR